MQKNSHTTILIIVFFALFLSKTMAQTSLIFPKTSPNNLFQKGGDSIMQKKNLFFFPERDVTQKRNLLYQPSIDGKPTVKFLGKTEDVQFMESVTTIVK